MPTLTKPRLTTRKKHNYEKIAALVNDDDHNLWAMVQLTRRLMSSARDREVGEFGISSIEAITLFLIKIIRQMDRKATPAEISRWLHQRPHSVSELLTRMAIRGLVRKEREKDRKNCKNVKLTKKGMAAYERSLERLTIHNIMSCLSNEERTQLWSIMLKMSDRAAKELSIKNVMTWPMPADYFRTE